MYEKIPLILFFTKILLLCLSVYLLYCHRDLAATVGPPSPAVLQPHPRLRALLRITNRDIFLVVKHVMAVRHRSQHQQFIYSYCAWGI